MRNNELVIILHGLESNQFIMKGFEKSYKRAGFDVYNSTYRCGRRDLPTVARDVTRELDEVTSGYRKIHFVCHSLGGLVVRYYVANRLNKKPLIEKIITMSSPHEGAKWVKDIPFGDFIGNTLFGEDLVQSLQDYEMIKSLPQLHAYKTLCITTDKKFHALNPLSWIVGSFIKGESDGFVAKDGMALPGASVKNFYLDHLFMCWDKELIRYTTDYLRG